MENLDCPLCNKEIFSDIGKGCIMCGMPLEHEGEFCSNKCKQIYIKIRSIKIRNE